MLRIDNALWAIEKYLMSKYGVDAARRDTDPIKWYIYTGRASAEVERKLINAKPYMVGRLLHRGGSYDEAIERVLTYIGAKNVI